jgi:hypothetical protein
MITDRRRVVQVKFPGHLVGRAKKLAGVPTKAFTLLVRNFFQQRERLRAAILRAGGENGVEQGNGSDVGRSKGSGLGGGNEEFVAFAGQRGEIGIGDADTVGAVGAGLLDALDGLAQAATEGDG